MHPVRVHPPRTLRTPPTRPTRTPASHHHPSIWQPASVGPPRTWTRRPTGYGQGGRTPPTPLPADVAPPRSHDHRLGRRCRGPWCPADSTLAARCTAGCPGLPPPSARSTAHQTGDHSGPGPRSTDRAHPARSTPPRSTPPTYPWPAGRTSTAPTARSPGPAPTHAPDGPNARVSRSDAAHHRRAGTHTGVDHPETGRAGSEPASPPSPAASPGPPPAAPGHRAPPSTPDAPDYPTPPGHRLPATTPAHPTQSTAPQPAETARYETHARTPPPPQHRTHDLGPPLRPATPTQPGGRPMTNAATGPHRRTTTTAPNPSTSSSHTARCHARDVTGS